MFDLIAQRRAKPARLDEIALHVDDHQRDASLGVSRRQLIGIRRGKEPLCSCRMSRHMPSDQREVGAGRRRFIDQLPIKHHDGTVGQFHDLEVLTHQKHSGPTITRGHNL